MLNRVFCIFVIPAVLLASLSKSVIFASFSLEKEYISRILCENKMKPQLKCKGKCYLKKVMSSQEKKESQQNSSVNGEFQLAIEHVQKKWSPFLPKFLFIFSAYLSKPSPGYSPAEFQPPETFHSFFC